MKSFKVASVQMNALKDNLKHNLKTHLLFIEMAKEKGVDLIMFPELSTTAHYGDETVVQLSEPADNGEIFDTMREAAGKYKLVIAYGLSEFAHGTHYNSHVLVGPEGLIGVQRKIHGSLDDYFYFRLGRRIEVFDLGFCKTGILICYDSGFSEAWRTLTLKGAEVILLPHAARSGYSFGQDSKVEEGAGIGKRIPEEQQLGELREFLKSGPGTHGAYAFENGVFAVFGNQVNYNGHSTHFGGAYILDPMGKTIVKTEDKLDDIMITADLKSEALESARLRPHYTVKTRRPELYGEITKMI